MTSPIRVLRQIVAPNGRHRGGSVVAAAPAAGVLDEEHLEALLDNDEVVVSESALCPTCARTTFHAMHRDGSRTCWTCQTVTGAEAAS